MKEQYIIEIYKDKRGKSEISEYLKQLQDNKTKDNYIKFNKISSYIELLSKNGLKLNNIYIKHLRDDIWELRPLKDRILFASWYNNRFILLSIFMKKTQKTPRREIEKAKRLFKDYKKRSEEKWESFKLGKN